MPCSPADPIPIRSVLSYIKACGPARRERRLSADHSAYFQCVRSARGISLFSAHRNWRATPRQLQACDLTFPKEILRYLPEPGKPDEFVVGGESPISYTALRGVRKRINLDTHFGETITPRRFRTTVATDISAMTHDLKPVQKMPGHSTPQMTLKHYDKGRSGAIDASNAIEKCYGLSAS